VRGESSYGPCFLRASSRRRSRFLAKYWSEWQDLNLATLVPNEEVYHPILETHLDARVRFILFTLFRTPWRRPELS
jgi:hypothetical protein